MRYKITISELRDSTHEYRSEDEYDVFVVKVEGDETIVQAIQRTVLEYIEPRFKVNLLDVVKGSPETDEAIKEALDKTAKYQHLRQAIVQTETDLIEIYQDNADIVTGIVLATGAIIELLERRIIK